MPPIETLPASHRICLSCRKPLEPSSSEGLCAGCLLGRALAFASEAEETSVAESDLIAASGLEGRTLGGYEILSTLAHGGMGVVFRARQKNPRREVALKVISAGELATRKMVERFHNEALAAARLEHPNIVPLYEVGEDRGWHYFSMQLIEGRTLAEQIRQARPAPEPAVELMVKIARAVAHAHQRGVLHRDLKPSNILLDEAGEPRLTDFGLAKISELDSGLTVTHAVLGTPAYMSPEQVAGKSRDITTSADVYSLGAILYELLTGHPPFEADSTPALLRKIAEEEPGRITNQELRVTDGGGREAQRKNRKSSPVTRVPADLEVICFKCLEKSPARRYATAADLADDLERWQRHEPILARPAGTYERTLKWARRHRAWAALGAIIMLSGLVLTTVSIFFNLRLDRARDLAEQNASRHHAQLVREHLREAGRATAAGDALTGVFALTEALRLESENEPAATAIRRRLGLTLRSAPELLRLWDAAGSVYRMQFSADNRFLSVGLRDGGVRTWNLANGAVTGFHPTDAEHSFGVVFSPRGDQAAESLLLPPFVRIRLLDRGETVNLPVSATCLGSVSYSGSGRWLITGGDRLRLWDTTTFAEVPLPDSMKGPWQRTVSSPDDRLILALNPQAEGHLLDTTTWTWRKTAEPIVSPAATLPSFSEDGRWLFTLTGEEVALTETATGKRRFSLPHSGLTYSAAFSADGHFLATAGFRDQARVWSLPSAATGTNLLPFRLPIRHETGANQVLFSPDGRWLATAGFDYQLRLQQADRHQLAAPLLHHTALIEAMAFSADGRFLASADAKGLVRVWDLEPRGVLTLAGVAAKPSPLFTRDGRQLVARDAEDRLCVWDTASGERFGAPLYQPSAPSAGRSATSEAPRPSMSNAPTDLAWDPSGQYLAAAVGAEGARVWKFADRRLLAAWTNSGTVQSVVFASVGVRLAIGNAEGKIRLEDLTTGQSDGEFQNPSLPAKRLAWSVAGPWLAVGGEQAFQVWDTVSGKPLAEPVPMPDTLRALEFAPDGRHLLAAAGNQAIAPGAARIWELPSLRSALPPLEHGDGLAAAVFSPDGQWVATGGEDNVVRLWRAASATAVGQAMRFEAIVPALRFDPSSRWLAAGSYRGYLSLWSIPGGELAGSPLALANDVTAVGFSPDGSSMLAGSERQNSWLVSLAPDLRPVEDLERIARGQTALRTGPDGALEPAAPAALAAEFATHLPSAEVFASPTEAVRWHDSVAAPAEATGAWFTAAFHLRRLVRLRPEDGTLRARLERAEAALTESGR
jgi:WD40 repeat protein/tRNA A-37 threonylcarbamoyl transferase component Bud32